MKRLLILLAGFEIADGIITHLLVRSGVVQEGNPLMAVIVGEGNFLTLKVIGALFCVLTLWYLYRRFRKVTLIAASSVVAFYGVVIAWNIWVFLTSSYPL